MKVQLQVWSESKPLHLSVFGFPIIPLVATHTVACAPLFLNSITASVMETPTSLGFPHQTRFYFHVLVTANVIENFPLSTLPSSTLKLIHSHLLTHPPCAFEWRQTPLYSLRSSPKLNPCFLSLSVFFFLYTQSLLITPPWHAHILWIPIFQISNDRDVPSSVNTDLNSSDSQLYANNKKENKSLCVTLAT